MGIELDTILQVWPDKDDVVEEKPNEEVEAKPTEEVAEPVEEKTTEEVEESTAKETTEEQAPEEKKEEVAETETKEPEVYVPEGELYDLLKEEGKEFKSVEEFNTHVTETVKQLKQQVQEFNAVSEKLADMTSKHPEFAILIKSLGQEKDFMEALIDAGIPSMFPESGDFDYEDFQKKIAERKEASKENLKNKKELEKNITQSKSNLEKFVKDNKAGDDFTNTVYKVVSEFAGGNVTNDVLNLFNKGLNYDKEVKRLTELANKEREAGLVQGRNEKIIKERQLKSNDVEVPDINSKSRVKEGASILSDEEKLMIEINNRRTHFKR
jgi:hypothetical protein